ncbi:MAG TPA: Rieske 2Fe-2S domain-containing protein [Chloroflexota bacterium]|nr:Rieske 2Fe-2S domain-containing protein [Chloroflexota bacterium]
MKLPPELPTVPPGSAEPPARPIKRWRAEFPYHWDADALVGRRQLLQFAVYTSGALFSVTALLAALGLVRRPEATPTVPIVAASDLPPGHAKYFNYPGPEDQAMLLHLPSGEFVAFSQKCTHLSCAVYYQPDRARLFCPCHEGVFSPATGGAIAGPPDRPLPRITLKMQGGTIYATGVTYATGSAT